MVESFKLFIHTYVYWVGLILGFAIVPGSLLFTAGVAPVNTPLWLAPFAGLLLFVIDRPSNMGAAALASITDPSIGCRICSHHAHRV